MTTVFISYSTKDHYFAELAAIKLAEADILLWRDKGKLRAGSEWRSGIEQGICDSIAVLVALSQHSTESSYVTFEWAFALGKGKVVVPLKLDGCQVHPRLEPIQHLDFSIPGSLPWAQLIDRIGEIDAEATSQEDSDLSSNRGSPLPLDPTVLKILTYLDQRGFRMVSYDGLRQRIDPALGDSILDAVVAANPTIFRHCVLKGGKIGIAKVIP